MLRFTGWEVNGNIVPLIYHVHDGDTLEVFPMDTKLHKQGQKARNLPAQFLADVHQWPAEVNRGRDPQLDRAIEVVLQQLEENPPDEYNRPQYPNQVEN